MSLPSSPSGAAMPNCTLLAQVRAALVAGVLTACGNAVEPSAFGEGLDLSGRWQVSDSTVYDILNASIGADGLRHIGAYVVAGTAMLTRVGEGSYAAELQVVVTYLDSVPGEPARRTPQSVGFVNPVVVVNDSIFGRSAGGDVVPPEAQATSTAVTWEYDAGSEQCLATIAGFHPATAACRQAVRWRR
jgi:hypothetical protein